MEKYLNNEEKRIYCKHRDRENSSKIIFFVTIFFYDNNNNIYFVKKLRKAKTNI